MPSWTPCLARAHQWKGWRQHRSDKLETILWWGWRAEEECVLCQVLTLSSSCLGGTWRGGGLQAFHKRGEQLLYLITLWHTVCYILWESQLKKLCNDCVFYVCADMETGLLSENYVISLNIQQIFILTHSQQRDRNVRTVWSCFPTETIQCLFEKQHCHLVFPKGRTWGTHLDCLWIFFNRTKSQNECKK